MSKRNSGKVNAQVTPFDNALATLVSVELAQACQHNDHDRAAAAIEVQVRNLALSIALAARGDSSGMSDILEGASYHLFEEAARFQKLGALIGFSATTHQSDKI
jgi:hypothetical protein